MNSIDFCLRRPVRGDSSSDLRAEPEGVEWCLILEGIVGVVTVEAGLEAEFPILLYRNRTSWIVQMDVTLAA